MDNWDVESSGKKFEEGFFVKIGLRFEGFPVGCFFWGESCWLFYFFKICLLLLCSQKVDNSDR